MDVICVCPPGLDEEGGNFMTEEEQTTQAILYEGLMEACIELGPSNCPSFQTWGVADRYILNFRVALIFHIVSMIKYGKP